MSTLTVKRTLFDARQMARMMRRMAAEIVERAGGTEALMLVGVRTRGVPLADFVAAEIARTEGVEVPVGVLDIALVVGVGGLSERIKTNETNIIQAMRSAIWKLGHNQSELG